MPQCYCHSNIQFQPGAFFMAYTISHVLVTSFPTIQFQTGHPCTMDQLASNVIFWCLPILGLNFQALFQYRDHFS